MKITKLFIILFFSLLLVAEECSNDVVESVVIAPNPVADHFELTFILKTDAELTITIYDMNGNVMIQPANSISYRAGENNLHVETGTLQSGAYILVVNNPSFLIREKFIVVH